MSASHFSSFEFHCSFGEFFTCYYKFIDLILIVNLKLFSDFSKKNINDILERKVRLKIHSTINARLVCVQKIVPLAIKSHFKNCWIWDVIVWCIYMIKTALLHICLMFLIILLRDFFHKIHIVLNSIIVDKCLQVFCGNI